jgi:hypothetical protein
LALEDGADVATQTGFRTCSITRREAVRRGTVRCMDTAQGGGYEADGSQDQGEGQWPESERAAALDALPDDAASEVEQVDEEATHVHDPDESPAEDATR